MRTIDLLDWVLAHARRTPGRTALAVMGIAVGGALLVSVLSVVQGLHDQAAASAVWLATPGRLVVTGSQLQDPDVARLAALPDAQDALPVLVVPVQLEYAGHRLTGGVAGVGFSVHGATPYHLVAGAPLDPDQPDGVVISRVAAQALAIADGSVGQHLTGTVAGVHDLTVVGIADELGDQNAIVGLPTAEDALAGSGVPSALAGRVSASLLIGGRAIGMDPVRYSAVLVVPKDLAAVPALADEIHAAGYTLIGTGQVPTSLDRAFKLLDIGLGILGVLASLGSALGVAQVLASRMSERTSEVGLLKALGATDPQVALLIGVEAVLLGLIGGVAGVVAGWAGAHAVSGLAELVFGPLPSPRLTLGLAVAAPIVTTLLACLAAAAPARRAWRLLPADALRHP